MRGIDPPSVAGPQINLGTPPSARTRPTLVGVKRANRARPPTRARHWRVVHFSVRPTLSAPLLQKSPLRRRRSRRFHESLSRFRPWACYPHNLLVRSVDYQLGTPRGRYDEYNSKFSLSKKPVLKVDANWILAGRTTGARCNMEPPHNTTKILFPNLK
jgi:hypothetical protein